MVTYAAADHAVRSLVISAKAIDSTTPAKPVRTAVPDDKVISVPAGYDIRPEPAPEAIGACASPQDVATPEAEDLVAELGTSELVIPCTEFDG